MSSKTCVLTMNKEYAKYLKSAEWNEIRVDVLINRKRCERCGSKKRLEVHHLTYKNIFNEQPDDLELLCKKCHVSEHKQKKNKLSLAQKVLLKKSKRTG